MVAQVAAWKKLLLALSLLSPQPPQSLLKMPPKTTFLAKNGQQMLPWTLESPTTQGFGMELCFPSAAVHKHQLENG